MRSLQVTLTVTSDTTTSQTVRCQIVYAADEGVSDAKNTFVVTGSWPEVRASAAVSIPWGGGSQQIYDESVTITKKTYPRPLTVQTSLDGAWGSGIVVASGRHTVPEIIAATTTTTTDAPATTTTTTAGTTTTTTTGSPTAVAYDRVAAARPVFSADTRDRHRESTGQIVVVHLVPAGQDTPTDEPLDLVSGTLTMDEGWTPHARADLVLAIPDDTVLDQITHGARLQITGGYVGPTGADVQLIADLWVWDRTVTRDLAGDTLQVTAVSSEAWAQTARAPQTAGWFYPAGTPASRVITDLLATAGWDQISVTLPVTSTLVSGLTIDQGAIWDAIQTAEDQVDGWVFCDQLGIWHVDPAPAESSAPVQIMAVGPAGTIIESRSARTSQEWATAVQVIHSWTTTTGDAMVVTGWATTDETVPAFWATIRRDTPISSTAAAHREARAILSRMITRGRAVSLRVVTALWVRPGDTVTVQLPTGVPERHLVTAVTIDLGTGAMDLTTRQPADITITTGE